MISAERELMSAEDVVLSNEVRVGLLTASVNSVGESKQQLTVTEVELRLLGWILT